MQTVASPDRNSVHNIRNPEMSPGLGKTQFSVGGQSMGMGGRDASSPLR